MSKVLSQAELASLAAETRKAVEQKLVGNDDLHRAFVLTRTYRNYIATCGEIAEEEMAEDLEPQSVEILKAAGQKVVELWHKGPAAWAANTDPED